MSRKKKKQSSSRVSPPLPTAEAFTRQITFDSMEDQIRGEERIQEEENQKLKEAQDIKKKLESAEVDRRLEALKQQLRLNTETQRRRGKKK
ncbi:hypothetical protein L0222_01425 [bacterium]|nr:hypothetical protein [bacterium]MCI0604203.1 hypothetical protein [bacterium]